MLLSLALLLASASAVQGSAQVTLAINPDDRVGSIKRGLLCVPAGGVDAKDVAFPSPRDIAARLERSDVIGQIVGVEATVCTSYMGVGKAPKSQLSISVQWHVGANDSCVGIAEGLVKTKGRDLRQDPTVMLDAIENSFIDWEKKTKVATPAC